jgi:23S rRNA-/tRNA-specific pseudouridylate synthase
LEKKSFALSYSTNIGILYSMIHLYRNTYHLIRKPADIWSVPGTTQGIQDILIHPDVDTILHNSYHLELKRRSTVAIDLTEHIIHHWWTVWKPTDFNTIDPWCLCNRLDLATRGYLIFVNNATQLEVYKKLQTSWAIRKYYLARIVGDIRYRLGNESSKAIDTSIMHHPTNISRMQINTTTDPKKLQQHTEITFLQYDADTNTSVVQCSITQGIRHQIRIHLSSIGHPIYWDTLYGAKGKKDGGLWLVSVGIAIR